ncbi:Hypothetical predicted protein [Octopus vulgaris]|uniref:Uncharacterized protein n=1 Tax=Octopus vulgaris TaxID=6645 RepID=A0AA36EXP8_OCTVU|nr:Hypothetical predicted protein [Octopus vulgaris]
MKEWGVANCRKKFYFENNNKKKRRRPSMIMMTPDQRRFNLILTNNTIEKLLNGRHSRTRDYKIVTICLLGFPFSLTNSRINFRGLPLRINRMSPVMYRSKINQP